MSERAKTIRADEIFEKANAAAERAFKERLSDVGRIDFEVGIFPDHGTCGLICRDFDLSRADGKALYATAADVTASLGDLVGDVKPSVSIFDRWLIFGFFPRDPIYFGR